MKTIITNNFELLGKFNDTQLILVSSNIGKVSMYWAIMDDAVNFQKNVEYIFSKYGNNKEDYLEVRRLWNNINRSGDMFYYLWQLSYYNKTRYNLKGEFNSGYGNHEDFVFNPNHIAEIAATLENVLILFDVDLDQWIGRAEDFIKSATAIALWENSIDKLNFHSIYPFLQNYDTQLFLIPKDVLPLAENEEYIKTSTDESFCEWAEWQGIVK